MSKSKDVFELIEERKALSDIEMKELISFCQFYWKPTDQDEFLMRFGHKPMWEQHFLRNEYRFRELKYI